MNATAWLIEFPEGPSWWTARDSAPDKLRNNDSAFNTDSLKAVRFARKEDADTVIAWLKDRGWSPTLTATEHEWVDVLRRRCQPESCVSLKEVGRPCPPGHGCNNSALH